MFGLLEKYKAVGCVLRIEHDNYVGMYRNGHLEHYDWEKHPTVFHEIDVDCNAWRYRGFIQDNNIHFGFKTFGQLFAWFTEDERNRLKKLGYKLKLYRPKDLWYTEKQAMFIRTGLEEVETLTNDRW